VAPLSCNSDNAVGSIDGSDKCGGIPIDSLQPHPLSLPETPVLLAGGAVPGAVNLPDELRGLEQLQMLELTARHWSNDSQLLLKAIEVELCRQTA
jgi:hypothetical protein